MNKFLKNSAIGRAIGKALVDTEYRRFGLLADDMWVEDGNPLVQEALRRLPEKLQVERAKRMRIAFDLSLKHQYLPPEKWTKPENDIEYFRPFYNEVKAEQEERRAWRL